MTVKREVYTGYGDHRAGFLDILVFTPEFGIGIENQLGALEQPDQLDRYWDWLQRTFRGFCLVYCNGTGRQPETLPPEKRCDNEHFRQWTYAADRESTVSRWLQLCAEACDADRVRWGLNPFREHLKWRLSDANTPEGRSVMEPEISEVVEYVLEDRAPLDLALTIRQGYDGLRQKIWSAFWTE